MNVVVDKLLTSYELQGRGKLVLLLHGWGDSSKGLRDLQQTLAKKYKVLALDLPGFGATQPPSKAWNLDNYAKFVHDSLSKLELGQPYAIIGHSHGGALSIRAVSLGLLKPHKIVLLASSGVRNRQSARRLLFMVLAKTGNLATLWMPERYRRALRQSLYDASGSDMLVAPQLEATFKKTVRQDVQGDAVQLNVPTLLIFAANDRTVPLSDGQRYNQLIKSSKLEVINEAGHFVHRDQPEKVLSLIKDFLA